MARQNGRDLQIKRGSTVIVVANTKTVNFNNEPVDVTGDSDAGFVTYLSRPGTRQISCDISGFVTDKVLRNAAALGTTLIAAHTIEWLAPNATVEYSITGDFYLSNYSETGASDGAIEFSATIASSGTFTVST